MRASDSSADPNVGDGDIVMGAIYFGAVLGGLVFAVVDDIWYARVSILEPKGSRGDTAC